MDKERARILCVHHRAEMGGAERSLLTLYSVLDRNAFEVVFAGPKEGRFAEAIAEEGLSHFPFQFSGLRHVPSLVKNVLLLSKLVRKHRFALMHSNGPQTNVPCGLVGKLTGVPTVWHARNLLNTGVTDWDRFFSPLANHIICNSQAIRNRFENIGGYHTKTSVVLNAVDQARISREVSSKAAVRTKEALPVNGWIIGTFDRLDPIKDHETILRAFKEIHRVHPRAHLLIVGDAFGAYSQIERQLVELAQELGVGKWVRFLGFRRDVFSLMSACDVVVHASKLEGCSRVLCEAQSVGRPVVASNGGGNPELVEDGKTGFLFPVGDHLALAGRVQRILADPDLMNSLSSVAKSKAMRDFTLERYGRETEHIYRSLLSSESRERM